MFSTRKQSASSEHGFSATPGSRSSALKVAPFPSALSRQFTVWRTACTSAKGTDSTCVRSHMLGGVEFGATTTVAGFPDTQNAMFDGLDITDVSPTEAFPPKNNRNERS